MKLSTMKILLTCLVAVLGSARGAQAAPVSIAIMIQEGANTAYLITGTAASLNINTADSALATAAPDFTFTGFTATANLSTLSLNGNGGVLGKGGTHSVTIMISETAYASAGAPSLLGSSSSYTFAGGSGGSFAYQSFAGPGGTFFGTTTPSPGHTYSPLKSADAFNEANTPFTPGTTFTLTQTYVFTSTSNADFFQPTGVTTVTTASVPEPSSLALLGLGSLVMLAIRRLA